MARDSSGPPEGIAAIHQRLQAGTEVLRSLAPDAVGAAWNRLMAEVLDPNSSFWTNAFEEEVAAEIGMHPQTLQASLSASLQGYELSDNPPLARSSAGPVAAVLAANVPVLAPQFLRAALLRRRAALVKPASGAARFAERFVDSLQRELALPETAYLTRRWDGGNLDDEHLARDFERIAVYGGAETVARFAELEQAPGQMALFGPKASVAVVSDRGEIDYRALARDIALFEQRGCLSLQIVYLLRPCSSAGEIATELSHALDTICQTLPTPDDLAAASAARQWVDVARLQGHEATGTPGRSAVVVEAPGAPFPPGGRSVSLRVVHSDDLIPRLRAAQERIQGLCWAGMASPPTAILQLAEQASWRLVPAGQLQQAGPDWLNGGIDLLQWLG